ncbi:MAG: hypothetical protein ACFFE6_08255 [Candidatus Thorarchaeota archaeon]
MMNKLQDLMNAKIPVQLVVDFNADKAHHKLVKGIIKNVSRNYVEIGRAATGDEKAQIGGDEVRVIIPIERIGEIIYAQNE